MRRNLVYSHSLSRAFSLASVTSPAPPPSSRLSGLQLDVLKLYRALLRVARSRDKKAAVSGAGGTDNSTQAGHNVLNKFDHISKGAHNNSIYSKGNCWYRKFIK